MRTFSAKEKLTKLQKFKNLTVHNKLKLYRTIILHTQNNYHTYTNFLKSADKHNLTPPNEKNSDEYKTQQHDSSQTQDGLTSDHLNHYTTDPI